MAFNPTDRPQTELISATELSFSSLAALAHGEIFAIWHRRFLEPSICDMSRRAIKSLVEQNHYTLTADLQSLGTSMGEAHESTENEERYFRTSLITAKTIRDVIFQDTLSPLDRLRLELDELWAHGATIARSPDGNPMLPGTIRRWPKGGQANPHMDQIDIKLLRHLTLTKRLAANTYLETPPPGAGGELQFWKTALTETQYQAMRRPDYGLDRQPLGPPDASITPETGDLVLFDAHYIHAVAPVQAGIRVTAACFVGISSFDHPLLVFA